MFFLTKQERLVLAVVVSVLLFGTILKALSTQYPGFLLSTELLKEGVLTCRVNVNTATKETLMAIPYIGEKTADKIIDYRNKHKGILAIEEIRNIDNVPLKNFDKFAKYLKVSYWK